MLHRQARAITEPVCLTAAMLLCCIMLMFIDSERGRVGGKAGWVAFIYRHERDREGGELPQPLCLSALSPPDSHCLPLLLRNASPTAPLPKGGGREPGRVSQTSREGMCVRRESEGELLVRLQTKSFLESCFLILLRDPVERSWEPTKGRWWKHAVRYAAGERLSLAALPAQRSHR